VERDASSEEDAHAKHLPSILSRFFRKGEAKDKAGALAEESPTDVASREEDVPLVVVRLAAASARPSATLNATLRSGKREELGEE
jgi:hypothetical protein